MYTFSYNSSKNGGMEQENNAYNFWCRVDELRGKTTLSELSSIMGVKEQSLRTMRSRCNIPKAVATQKLADYLHTTVDYLMTGIHIRPVDNLCPEARYVQESPEARLLVSQVMKDPALLSALAAVIESTRKEKVK